MIRQLTHDTSARSSLSVVHFIRRLFSQHWHSLFVFAIVILAGVWVHSTLIHTVNPDGTSYIQIARHYAALDITRAINGYWSPLLPWLLALPIKLGIDPLLAFHALHFCLALGVTGAALWYGRRFATSLRAKIFQLSTASSLGILLMFWGAAPITPDLLSGVILALVIYLSHRFLSHPAPRRAISLGAGLAGLYFAKAIGFYLSLAVIAILFSWVLYNRLLPRYRTPLLITLVTFFLLATPWIAAISLKYHSLTLSTAGSYNMSIIGPERPAHPHTTSAIESLRAPTDIWTWDDPSYYDMPLWSIKQHFAYFVAHSLQTIGENVTILLGLSPFVLLSAIALLQRTRQSPSRLLLLTTGLLALLAHSVFFSEARYTWLTAVPLLLAGFYVTVRTPSRTTTLAASMGLLLTIVSMVPVLSTYQREGFVSDARAKLAKDTQHMVPLGSRVVGNDPAYGKPFDYCFFTHTACVGRTNLTTDSDETARFMKRHTIPLYVDYAPPQEAAGLEVVYTNTVANSYCSKREHEIGICRAAVHLTIYAVRR